MRLDITAAVLTFAATVRRRGHDTPWCIITVARTEDGSNCVLFQIGPAAPGPGGIVCAPVKI